MQTTLAKWWCKAVSIPCLNLWGSTRISRLRFNRTLAPMFLRTQLLQTSPSLRQHRQLRKLQVAERVSSRKNLSQKIPQIMRKWRSNSNFQIWQTSWSICLQYLDAHRQPMLTLTSHSRSSSPLKIIQIHNKRHLVVQNHRRKLQSDSRVTQTIFTDRPVNGTMLFQTKKFKNWWTPRARINLQLQIVIKMLLQKPSMANQAAWSLSSITATWAWSGRARGPVSASSPTSESSKKWMCYQAYIIWAIPVSQIVWFSAWPTRGCSVSTADLANTARIASVTLPNSNSWRRSMSFPSKNWNGYR